ncbi:MAG: serine hydrolase domain-containing protein [Dysgonamonadaceae bacterium]
MSNQLFAQTGYYKINSVNALSIYPKEISEVIFSNTKDLPNNTQLSIAIIQNGKTNYYGIIKTNDKIKPIENQNKVFEIGSITKVFTSTVLASLVEDGEIKLTDPINSYFPFTFNNNTKITFKDLANHTSGLSRLPENLDLTNEGNPYKAYGKIQIEEYLKNILKIENEIAKTFLYSNFGTGLLGYTLGLSQKTSFEKLLQKKVFDKYKMKNSFTSSHNLANKLVKGQNPEGEITSNWDWDVLFGAGGILSTTEDLVKFATAQFNPNNTDLTLTRTPTFNINENVKIGLGWHLLKSKNGKDFVWHNGGTGGYTSSMAINVNDKTAVIILSNLSAFHHEMENIDKLCFEIMSDTEKSQSVDQALCFGWIDGVR